MILFASRGWRGDRPLDEFRNPRVEIDVFMRAVSGFKDAEMCGPRARALEGGDIDCLLFSLGLILLRNTTNCVVCRRCCGDLQTMAFESGEEWVFKKIER